MPLFATSESPEHAQCDFCELPITHAATPDAEGHQYCCYGCRFAASIAATSGDEAQARWTMTKLGLAVFFSMNVMVCTLLLWSESSGTADEISAAWYGLFRYASFMFTLPVLLLLGPPIVDDARRDILAGKTSMSVLLIVGVASAMGYSVYSVLFGGHVYCEVACAILLGVTFGKWLEANGKLQTTEALRGLSKLLPETVRVVRDQLEEIIPAAELRTGDGFRVLPGERIVADGRIQVGEAFVDEQAISGESMPVHKIANSLVFGGTLVIDGPLLVEATSLAGEGTIAKMIAAVKQGAESKSHYERLAERISRWFLPAVILIALMTFALHLQRGEMERGLLAAVAVLVIACPCSLGLATPMAMWAAIARAAEQGILIRSGDSLTQFAGVKTICFDKTGTLTTGQPEFLSVRLAERVAEAEVASLVKAVIADSSHPLAVALKSWAALNQIPGATNKPALQIRHLPGRGLVARGDDLQADVYLGNRRWLEASGEDCSRLPAPDDSASETLIAWNGQVRAQFLFSEELRPGIASAVNALTAEGLSLLMLTGDRESRAQRLATSLGMRYQAELLPEEKLVALKLVPPEQRPVAMVGDGINDAPALATAEVGISLASGTDIARNSAAICLLRNHLNSLPFLFRLAVRTRRTLHWNLTWALAYNVVGVALAAAGCLHPVIAAVAMGLSGLFVVLNSLALARFERVNPADEAALDQSPHVSALPTAGLNGSAS